VVETAGGIRPDGGVTLRFRDMLRVGLHARFDTSFCQLMLTQDRALLRTSSAPNRQPHLLPIASTALPPALVHVLISQLRYEIGVALPGRGLMIRLHGNNNNNNNNNNTLTPLYSPHFTPLCATLCCSTCNSPTPCPSFSYPSHYQVRLQTCVHGGVSTGAAGYTFPRSVREGLTLWRGVGPAMTRGVIAGSVWLGTNEYFKRMLGAKDSEPFAPGKRRTTCR
jgi:hypothetical protein